MVNNRRNYEMIAKGIRYGERFYRRIMKETGEGG